jgi:hypothetical protein
VSIAAMNWAWSLTLSPREKLVLMSLADAADDRGVCWPSIPTVARKCCLSKRTIQRTLRGLIREARAGRFTPTLALKVGVTRRQREKNEAALRRAEVDQLKILETRRGGEDSALAKKLRTIRDRQKGNLNREH